MNILTLETTTMACSAALLTEAGITERYEVAPQQHTHILLPMIDSLLNESGIELSQLAAIGYGHGPGAFTGVRIGVSVAQGLAAGADLGLVAISSLAMVAAQVLHTNPQKTVCVAQDARMAEVYTGRYEMIAGMASVIGEERLCAPDAIGSTDADLLAGDAWGRIGALEEVSAGRPVMSKYPHAKFALGLAKMALVNGDILTAAQAMPNYLRDSVVKPV